MPQATDSTSLAGRQDTNLLALVESYMNGIITRQGKDQCLVAEMNRFVTFPCWLERESITTQNICPLVLTKWKLLGPVSAIINFPLKCKVLHQLAESLDILG